MHVFKFTENLRSASSNISSYGMADWMYFVSKLHQPDAFLKNTIQYPKARSCNTCVCQPEGSCRSKGCLGSLAES
jgi:hypothetical protein